jgi:hypothetical protein
VKSIQNGASRRKPQQREAQRIIWETLDPLHQRPNDNLPDWLRSRLSNAVHLAANEKSIRQLIRQLESGSSESRRTAASKLRNRLVARQGLFVCPVTKCQSPISFWKREIPGILAVNGDAGLALACPQHRGLLDEIDGASKPSSPIALTSKPQIYQWFRIAMLIRGFEEFGIDPMANFIRGVLPDNPWQAMSSISEAVFLKKIETKRSVRSKPTLGHDLNVPDWYAYEIYKRRGRLYLLEADLQGITEETARLQRPH